MAAPKAPAGLGPKSLKLWRSLTRAYEFRADELRVLEDACREVDLIERFESALDGADLVVSGSMGQPVASPLVQEIRQHRSVVQRLLASLKLPDDENESVKTTRSSSARAAAMARWGRAS